MYPLVELNVCDDRNDARIPGNLSIAFRRFLESMGMVSFNRHNRTYPTVPVDHFAPALATMGIPNFDGEFWFVFQRLRGSSVRRAYGFGLYFYTPIDVDPAARRLCCGWKL